MFPTIGHPYAPMRHGMRQAVLFSTIALSVMSLVASFLDHQATVYYADRTNRQILIWSRNNSGGNATVLSNVAMSAYSPLFVTINRDIYYSYGFRGGQIMRRSVSESQPAQVAEFTRECYGLFIDQQKTLYCSVKDEHHVATTSLYADGQVNTIRAGTATSGSAANQLSSPWGVFVDSDLSLFVADAGNHRIQLFPPNQTNASTVAGNNTPCGLYLNYPTDVVVDGSGYMYIADSRNHRVLRVGWGEYRCLTGCQSQAGSAANQLNRPSSLRLDSSGNLFVIDEKNRRIQKFFIHRHCNRTYALRLLFVQYFEFVFVTVETSGANVSMSCPTLNGTLSQPNPCPTPQQIGLFCNETNMPCSVLTPCQNNGSCLHVSNNTRRYSCSCPSGFGGDHCEVDMRPCGTSPCLYNG